MLDFCLGRFPLFHLRDRLFVLASRFVIEQHAIGKFKAVSLPLVHFVMLRDVLPSGDLVLMERDRLLPNLLTLILRGDNEPQQATVLVETAD
ncbi:hypothetical protein [Stenomitos frigidus]|uniref:hypothetical protein n=1 Tax=Stenomitos frigidus TaxID=1886765 RepID=UPI0015E6F626|nr:hypothetical protein [Stenomitos frigidus]